MKILIFLFTILTFPAHAELLCEPVKSRGEGHWPIPEEKFTKENAEKAAVKLQELVAYSEKPEKYFASNYGVDYQSLVTMELLAIEGHMLKTVALKDKAENHPSVKHTIKHFCDFLNKKAMAWH